MNLMTIMYIAIQEALSDPEDMSSSYNKLRMSRIPPPPSPLDRFARTALTVTKSS